MVALKYVMSGDCQESHHGKSRVGNILHKNHCVFFLVSFRHQLFLAHGFWIHSQVVVRQVLLQIYWDADSLA